jgi:diguanylate cyclase (GGDEF)-like protein/PAS domain S-box-containing protein
MTFDQPRRRLPVFWGSLILFILVVAGGLIVTSFVSRFGEDLEREELKLLAATAAASFDTDTVRKLRGGNPSDIGTESFERVREQLQKIRGANPESRFVYLMTTEKDQVVFLADAEPPESKDYSAPGEVYKEASPALHRLFSQGKPFTEGPYQDHWGVWVTGLAPLIDSRTGQVIAVLGIDVRADQWLASVSRYKWFSIALTVLVAGIMALLLIGIHFQGRFSSSIKHLNQDLEQELGERKRAEQGLRLAAAVIENTTEGIAVTRSDGTIRSVNRSFEQITGWSAREAIGQTMKILKSGEHNEEFYRKMWESLGETDKWKGEIWNRRKSGELYPQATTINALKDSDGTVGHYAVIFSDVTEQKQLENRLRSLSALDGLTGLHNRRAFDETFLKEWHRAVRESSPLSVIMLDIDCFKKYNDCYGHLEGDACIQQVAQVLKGCVRRAADFPARYGGEEFVVILPETDQTGARGVANRIREEIQSLAILHENSEVATVVTVSIGLATEVPRVEEIAANLIERADKALYQAKSSGRNRVETL